MSIRYIISAFLIITTFQGFAQKSPQEIKGDKYFNKLAYQKAVIQYKEAGRLSSEGLKNMALAYLKLRNFADAETYYEKYIALNNYSDEDLYNYAAILRANAKYDDSEVWMKKFAEKNPNDSRAKDFNKNGNNVVNLLKDEGRYQISNISINSENQDFGPSYWNDKLVFASSTRELGPIKKNYSWNGKPYLDIYVADIDKNNNLKDAQSLNRYHKENINRDMHEGPAAFAKKGTLMAFTRNNYIQTSEEGIHKLDIFFSYFKDGTWVNETAFKLNNKDYSVGHPWLSEDGNMMYFTSDMPGGFGGTDIYKIERKEGGEWGETINLGYSINTLGDEMFPFYNESSGFFFFASNAHTGLGGLDIFIVNAPNHKMGKLMNLGAPLNSSSDDFALIADAEMKTGYFSSNRSGGKGDDDIYRLEFLKPFVFTKTIEGVAYNKDTIIRDGAIIALYDENGIFVAETIADSNGFYSFDVENFEIAYFIESKKNDFDDVKTNKIDVSGPLNVVQADVVMERRPVFNLLCKITDKTTANPISDVKITIIDKDKGTEKVILSGNQGEVAKILEGYRKNDKTNIELQIEKEGFLPKTISFNQVLEKSGTYLINETLEPVKMDVGKDLADLFKIMPIYFDFDKFNIRKDAAEELDKIVDIMNKYPNLVIELGSHTDCRGTYRYNIRLSDNRAKTSAAYIASKISNPERIYGMGYGESKHVNDCTCEGLKKSMCSEAEHQMNRRTEFIIVGNEGIDKLDPQRMEVLKKNTNYVIGSKFYSNSSSVNLLFSDFEFLSSVQKQASDNKEYILIVGSYKQKEYAERIFKALTNSGFMGYIEIVKNGYTRIGAYVYCKGPDELDNIKKQISMNFPQEAWVLKK